jgi:hypothetical protein
MTEPTGRTIDGEPWAEARGPHLPDRLTGIPLLVWPFMILTAIQVVDLGVANSTALATDPFLLLQAAFRSIADVTASLLGAALFLRHRNAIRAVPLLVVGVTLIAVVQALDLLRAPLLPMFEAIWPVAADDSSSGAVLVAMFYVWAAAIIGTFGLLYLARGLDDARRFDAPPARVVVTALLVVALLITALGVAGYLRIPADTVFGGPVLFALNTAVGLATLLALCYLVSIAVRGWRAGEEPSIAWGLVALSGCLSLLVSAVVTVASVSLVADFRVISPVVSTASAIGGVALLAAFLLGLPSTEQIEWEVVEPRAPTPDPPAATRSGSAGS